MNTITVSGILTADVTMRQTSAGKSVSNYRIAVRRSFKRDGQPDADFFNCTVFGKSAEFANKYFKKGTKVLITGEMQNDNYQGKDGKMVYRDVIMVSRQEFAESKARTKERQAAAANGSASAQTTKAAAPAQDPKIEVDAEWFMKIPDGIDEELPFN